MSVTLDVRETLLASLRAGLLAEFPAGLGGLDLDLAEDLAGQALEAGLDAGATMRAVADAAVALFTLDPAPLPTQRPGSPTADTAEELARSALAATAMMLNLCGDHAVWSALREAAQAHGLDPYLVPPTELLGSDEARARYSAGLARISRRAAHAAEEDR